MLFLIGNICYSSHWLLFIENKHSLRNKILKNIPDAYSSEHKQNLAENEGMATKTKSTTSTDLFFQPETIFLYILTSIVLKNNILLLVVHVYVKVNLNQVKYTVKLSFT